MAPTWPIGPTQQPTLTFGGLSTSTTISDPYRPFGGLPMSTGPISSPFNLGVPVAAPKKFALFPLGTRPVATPLRHPGQSISPSQVAGTGAASWGANATAIASNLLASMGSAVTTPAGWFSSTPPPAASNPLGGMMPMLLAGAAVIYLVMK